jgi:hypothetical protein
LTSTRLKAPGINDNWSCFGAIVIVSAVGPALILLVSVVPALAVELGPTLLDLGLCIYVNSCTFAASEARGSWLLSDGILLYAFWVSLSAGFASFATLESAFYIFPRSAGILVPGWNATLMFVLSLYFPGESMRSLISLGWAGVALVSVHYYLCYKALPLYQPPEAVPGEAQEVSPVSRATAEFIAFPGGPSPRQRRALVVLALHVSAIFGLAYYALVTDRPILLVCCIGVGTYCGLHLLHQILSSSGARALTIGSTGVSCHGKCLSWDEVGRVWGGPDGYRHIVMIETTAEAANRMLQATNWISRLSALCDVARRKADMAAHQVTIDTRFYLGEAAEILRAIEARRPPGSRWKFSAEVSRSSTAAIPSQINY